MDEDCIKLHQCRQRLASLVCDDVDLQSSLVQAESQFDSSSVRAWLFGHSRRVQRQVGRHQCINMADNPERRLRADSQTVAY